jgi:hypothetical protein
MSKELFQVILNKQFYLNNKDLIHRDLFEGEVKGLYESVLHAYTQGAEALTIPELRSIHTTLNPTETLAQLKLIDKYLDDLTELTPISFKAASIILKQARINAKMDELGTLACQRQGELHIEKIKELLFDVERLKGGESSTEIVNLDIASLLERTSKNCRWRFNIPELESRVGGIGDASFSLLAGRVNSGKSLAALSFCFSPNGFADQGAKILYMCNEEDGAFPGLRAVSAFTGMTAQEITADKEKAARLFARIKDNVIILDNARMSMTGLNKMVEKYKPDIVVADMLDHIQIGGEYGREDQRLGQVYRQAREIGKVHRLAFIGVSQTSADSDGKMHYGFDSLANSKTEKPAACDLILLLGADAPNDQGQYSDVRAINVAKNKITGWHGAVSCIIQPQISRLVA